MTNTAGDADRFAAAHEALKADKTVQFDLTSPPAPPQTPEWLRAFLNWLGEMLEPVGRFFRWIGGFMPDAPAARIMLWSLLAIAVAFILWTIYLRLRTGEWRLPRIRRAPVPEMAEEEQWTPGHEPVHSWLREADELAGQGRFAEAVHHLLFRSIEDISNRRPNAVRPALTSREISAAEVIPNQARGLFTGLVSLVERSLFGGRPVGEEDWTTARAAYADFALPQAWRA